jgi:formate dehydrogenase iron-sulfur subunit
MSNAILVDPSKCINCKACQVACKEWNQTGYDLDNAKAYADLNIPPAITPKTWMRLIVKEEESDGRINLRFTKTQCMHCMDAACVEACPTGATYKDAEGYTVYDARKCIGCNYCVSACPFQSCKYDAEKKEIFRCVFCPDRRAAGLATACSTHCPSGCLTFGERDQLLKEAEKRVAEYKKDHPNARVYGEDEMRGLHYIYVLQDTPSSYGLPDKPTVPAGVTIWNALVKPGGSVAAAALVIGLGTAAAINARHRRMEKLQSEKESDK